MRWGTSLFSSSVTFIMKVNVIHINVKPLIKVKNLGVVFKKKKKKRRKEQGNNHAMLLS